MDFLYGFLSNISRDLVCGAVNQLRYPCCFNNFVEELEKEERNLIATRESVKDRVDSAKKQTKKTAEVVPKWLEDADIGEADVKNLLNNAKAKKSCCFGHCPNWILRYHFGRKLANKKKELQELIKKGEPFVQLERVATVPSETLYFPSDKYLKFESREYAYKQVMEAVKDEEVNMIGLYGMGGCGKTTLAEEIKKIAEAEHLFDKVLFVAVSSTVEVRRIQEKIASSLQFTFQVNEERERATALCERITKEKKILVILDDVWQRLDFGAIGIPPTEHHKGCKVLITTRSEDVCTLMDCQKKIQLQILTDDEAWNLFQKQARISEDTSDSLKHLAREISDECKGLPVAIAAVASSLKGKDEVIWKVALNKLRSSKPMNIEKGLIDPYKCLKLSYDNLDTEEAKSLFLLCSAFPEDYEIRIEVLMKLAIGLGVVGEVHSYHEARNEVIAAKIKLVSSCLLMLDVDDYDGYECLKMHDLVHDVAHLIAKDENKVIECQLDNDVTLEQCSIRYLWCKEFPNDLDCSNLEFLYIVTELEVLDEIFKRMGKLRVLYLANEREDNKLPLSTMSFKTLTDLRCLILDGWELSDISFLRDTKKLQSLSLYGCSLSSFLDLQTGEFYKQLTKLKLLELVYCEMERNNYNVIGGIPHLEELRIFDNNEEWHDWNEHTIELFKTFGVPPELQYYAIILGNFHGRYAYRAMSSDEGILSLSCFDISNESIKGLAKRAKVLQMGNIKGGVKNIIPHVFEMKEGSLHKLNALVIYDSEEIECVVDTNNYSSEVGTLFSQLLQLGIFKMDNLRVLWDGCLPPRETFQKLKELCLWECPELTSLFTHTAGPFTLSNLTEVQLKSCQKLRTLFTVSTAKTLTSLKGLNIKDCDDLKHIVTSESDHKNEKEDIVEHDHDLQSVISMFPSLQIVDINRCAKLEVIFPPCCLPELKSLKIKQCKELKHIMEQDLEEDKNLSRPLPPQPCFPKLTKLVVEKCDKLKRVLFTSASTDLSNLEILIINGAAELEELFGCEHGKVHEIENAKVELPKLKLIIFMNLPNLCQRDELSAVKRRIVHNCPKLTLTSTTTPRELKENFPNSDFENAQLSERELQDLSDELSLQISEESNKKSVGEVDGSEVQATTTSINLELNGMSSPNPLDISQHETNIELEWDPMPENTPPLQMKQEDLATSKTEPTCSFLRVRNIVGMVHTQKQIESGPLDFESYKFLLLENESNRTPHLQLLEQKLSPISSPKLTELVDQDSSSEAGFPDQHALEDTINIEDIRKESIEVPVSKGPTNKTLSTGLEGISLGGGISTHTKSSGGGILAQGSQVVEIDDKLNESKTVTGTRLEAYKSFVDLDDTQIALLAEALTAYPHLWNSCQKFSERFQAWMLKNLADMLLLLRNESAGGVTPQTEKKFHKLCDEAIELGFDSSWVDEMRQHIVGTRDPKLEEDRAQAQINELFKRSTGAKMVLDSQVVGQGDTPNEHYMGTSQCQKIQNVGNSIKGGSKLLIDEECGIGVARNDFIVAPRNQEPKEFELADRQSMSGPSMVNHQRPLEEISEIRPSQTHPDTQC